MCAVLKKKCCCGTTKDLKFVAAAAATERETAMELAAGSVGDGYNIHIVAIVIPTAVSSDLLLAGTFFLTLVCKF